MKRDCRALSSLLPGALLLGGLALASPLTARAQEAPPPSSIPPPHDMSNMPGMAKPDTPAAPPPDTMSGMAHNSKSAAGHDDMANMGSRSSMQMGPMQGGRPPRDARSANYSDGVGYGPMTGMDMADNAPFGRLLIDQLEQFHGRNANGQTWEAEGWYGKDSDKLWLRTEGERNRSTLETADVEAFWNHNISTYWGTQVGARQDFGVGPDRTWGAFGLQGLAPYWFEVEATAYVGTEGRTAARLRGEYDLLFTQRLILQPEAEINAYGKSDPQRRIGSGLSDIEIGLRLRYEIRRELAPYIGINWVNQFGPTANYARMDGQPAIDLRIVAGVRAWY